MGGFWKQTFVEVKMNPFQEYFKLEKILRRNPLLNDVFIGVIQHERFDIINVDVIQRDLEPNMSLGRYISKFGESLKRIANKSDSLEIPEQFDEDYMFAIFFITLCDDEVPHEQSSASIQVTNAIMYYAICKQNDALLRKEIFVLIFGMSLGKLALRYEDDLSIPTQLIFDLNDFIIKNNFTNNSLKYIIRYMVALTMKSCLPLTDITFFDQNTYCEKMAFVILSNIITRKYAIESTRQRMIQFMFNQLYYNINKARMTDEERESIQMNFRSLICQSAPNLIKPNAFIYGMVNVLLSRPTDKSLMAIINDLPFKLYYDIVKLVYKAARESYSHAKQALLYNILQSPCLAETDDHKNLQTFMITKVVESIFWSMKLEDSDARVNTIQLIDCVLRLNDVETTTVLIKMFEDHSYYAGYKLLNFAYEHTHINWENDYKTMNQYFISIFCNVLLLRRKQYENNFIQFKLLLGAADATDLIPCIPILLKVVKSFANHFDMITKPIFSALSFHAISPNSEFLQYLNIMNDLMFHVDDEIISVPKSVMLNWILNGLEYKSIIWKKLISNKLITSNTVQNLFEGILSGEENSWRMLSVILPNMPNETFPLNIRDYWRDITRRSQLWQTNDIIYILNCVGLVIELKVFKTEYEKNFFIDVFNFICSEVRFREIPLPKVSQALVAANKIMDSLHLDVANIRILYKDIEESVEKNLSLYTPKIEHKYSKYLLRDGLYYREMGLVFSEHVQPKLTVVQLVVKTLENLEGFNVANQEIICTVLRMAVQLGIKYKEMQEITNSSLKNLVPSANYHLKSTILYCFYDIAMLQSGTFEGMLPILYDFFLSDIWELQYQASKLLIGLINGNRYVPNAWELYILMNLCAEENIYKFYDEDVMKIFFIKCKKCFGDYFTSILLYFHKLYHQNKYELTNEQQCKLPRIDVAMEKRKFLYDLILRQFNMKIKLKIVNELYVAIVDNFYKLPLDFPENYELLQDIIYITYTAARNETLFFPKNNKAVYEQSIVDINALAIFTANKKDIIQDEDEEKILKKILLALLKLLEKMDKHGRVVIPELFHLLLAMVHWFYDKIFNMLVDEGRNGIIRRALARVPYYFTVFKPLLHMEVPINLEETSSNLIV